MPSYLITGTSRGLGLELARQLSTSEKNIIFATSRSQKPTPALQSMIDAAKGTVIYVQLDATDVESVNRAAREVEKYLQEKTGEKGLDVLINNAGIMTTAPNGIATMDKEDFAASWDSNVIGVLNVTNAFLPLLDAGKEKKVFNVSTTLGSIAMSSTYAVFPAPAYKITKAALNMLTVQYALEYKDRGYTFVALSPGWVKTDLGTDAADLTVEQSAKVTLEIVLGKGAEDTGKFFNVKVDGFEKGRAAMNYYDGAEVSW